jgi:diguanylate cyclase (GGDEF)-like protein/PAS domain S-box-containing protein
MGDCVMGYNKVSCALSSSCEAAWIPFKTTVIYTLVGGLWILFSDALLASLVTDPAMLTPLQTMKGWLYISITAGMLYFLIHHNMATLHHSREALDTSYRELDSNYKKLVATQEKLKQQGDELLYSDEQLRVRDEQYRMLFEGNPHPMWVYDLETFEFIAVNNAAIRTYGFSREEFLAMTIQEIRPYEDIPALLKVVSQKIDGIQCAGIWRHQKKDSTIFYVEITIASLTFNGRNAHLIHAHDITERKRAEEKIHYLAYYDSLTDLPNRTLFTDRLVQALSHAQSNNTMLSVIVIDLNRFKYINDAMGHMIGDQLLQQTAQRIRACLPLAGTVARMGNDEFVILIPEIDHSKDPVKTIELIFQYLAAPFHLDNQEIFITASAGIALYPADGDDANTLIKNADAAMYRAKEHGGNYHQFYSRFMNVDIKERLVLENQIRHALESKEFILHYQPQVHGQTGQIVGVEALVRWQHPHRGLLLPAQFINLAEDTGLIVPLGEWVLHTACAQNKAWQMLGFSPIRVAVNLSPLQFQQQNLVQFIVNILEQTRLDPQWLDLEITETTAMKDVNFTIQTLSNLRAMGIQISIDDFGTGYSSLNYLKRFPINTLKIDRSFINDILTNADNATIVKTIIVLAQNLKLKAVAEGVETIEQRSFLTQQYCDEMQGYFFGEPVSAEEIVRLLQTGMKFPQR